MKIELTKAFANGMKLTVEDPEGTPVKLFHVLGALYEAFSEEKCGACGSVAIHPEVRSKDGNFFFSWRCESCGCTLDMGQHKNGKTLFAKRTLPDGSFDTKHRGWYLYNAKKAAAPDNPYSGTTPPKEDQPLSEQSPF
jgi:hypothetical protein